MRCDRSTEPHQPILLINTRARRRFEGDYGVGVLASIHETFGKDEEVGAKLKNFQNAMGSAVKLATTAEAQTFSKVDDGTTRVVSVSHKEVDPDAPRSELMQTPAGLEAAEAMQKKQLAVARQMAVMQQDVLAQLLSWNEEEREEQLKYAKQTHEDFVRQVREIEDVQERANLMLTVNPEVQRTLVVHKVWEEMKRTNGGVAPSIKMNKDFVPPKAGAGGGCDNPNHASK